MDRRLALDVSAFLTRNSDVSVYCSRSKALYMELFP
jgi:hypothetical protein